MTATFNRLMPPGIDGATVLSPDELTGQVDAVLARVGAGERFVVERDGQRLAMVVPAEAPLGVTGRHLTKRIGDLMIPGDGFADDLEAIQAEQRPAVMPEWPD